MKASDERPVRLINRRTFLTTVAVTLGGAIPLLTSCGQAPAQQAAQPTKAAEPTKPAAASTPAPTQAAAAATQAPGKAAEPVTIKYLTWWWAEKGRNDAWRGLVTKFHASQKDVRVEEVGFAYSEYFQKVMQQLAGGRLDADVLSFYDEMAVRLMAGKFLEPVDDIPVKLGIKDKLLKAPHDFVTVNGKLNALLMSLTPYALIYNKELYEKEGVAKPPATREEYLDVAKRVTKRPNQFGHASRSTMAEQNGWWQDLTQWVLGYDGLWSAAGKKPLVTSDAVLNAVKTYKKLYDEAMPQGATASDYRRMAWEGKIVQYVDNSANINILKTGNEAIYPKILTSAPPWPNKKSIAIPNYVGIYAGSTKKDAGRLWWEFVFKKENLQSLYEAALDIVPPYEGALRDEWIKGLPWASGFQAANGVVFISTVPSFEANVAEFRQITLQKVSEVLTAGKAPEQALAEAQKELEALAGRI
ncbi:MAG: extracellular solute-binding protein [Chloroflexota bacterium]